MLQDVQKQLALSNLQDANKQLEVTKRHRLVHLWLTSTIAGYKLTLLSWQWLVWASIRRSPCSGSEAALSLFFSLSCTIRHYQRPALDRQVANDPGIPDLTRENNGASCATGLGKSGLTSPFCKDTRCWPMRANTRSSARLLRIEFFGAKCSLSIPAVHSIPMNSQYRVTCRQTA